MENGDIASLFELLFDLEAARCGDIFKVDPAEAVGDKLYRADELVNVLGIHADRESVNTRKFLEKRAFALHYGHRSSRSDVAKSENGSTVRDNSNKVVSSCKVVGKLRVLFNFKARLRNARSVCKRKLLTVFDRTA